MSTSRRNDLLQLIGPVRRRLQIRTALSMMTTGAIIGALLYLTANVARAGGMVLNTGMIVPMTAIPALIAGVAGLFVSQSWHRAAQFIDRFYGLKDHVVSALEFSALPPEPHRDLQIESALRRMKNLYPEDVVPLQLPRNGRIALAILASAVGLLLLPHPGHDQVLAESTVVENLQTVHDDLALQLDQLDQLAEDSGMAPVKELVNALRSEVEKLQAQKAGLKETLSTISGMQMQMKELAAGLNIRQMESQLDEVAAALANAEPFETPADALKKEALDEAATALENIDAESLSPEQAGLTSEELARSGDAARQKGFDEMADTLDELSNAVANRDTDDVEKKSLELADQIRQHKAAKAMDSLLNSQLDVLNRSKKLSLDSNSEGNGASANATGMNQKTGKSNRTSEAASRKAGGKSAGNINEEKTRLEGQLQMARVSGKMTDQGATEIERTIAGESAQQATRMAREAFAEYEKQSEAALQADPVPPGHRETIRRYFRLIRPDQGVEAGAAAAPK